ncbi:hypothetical protein [Aeromonas rivipollensis]|uniref:hypothetical protein n=1 Tax=Aeromonas rivipollensis TaxID=948519 RepID=UPI00398A12DC
MADSLPVFLFCDYFIAKRGSQANTLRYQSYVCKVIILNEFFVAVMKAERSYTEGSAIGLVLPFI